MSQVKQIKYRPVLTAVQIHKIIDLCKLESPISTEAISIIGVLAPYAAKIENHAVSSAYTVEGTRTSSPNNPNSLLSKLGGTALPPTATAESSAMLKEVYWEQSYLSYKADPTACSLVQIEAAKEWMYLKDLMTGEEVREFEQNLMGGL